MNDIVFDAVTRSFPRAGGSVPALLPTTLRVAAGEFVAIVGPSGCGKTTLLRMAAGLERPTAGRVTVAGLPITGPGPDRAVVFQHFALLPWKTVRANIGFGLRCRGTPRAERARRVGHYLDLMGLAAHADSYPHQLSGGMQQRVAIARSFILDPPVLLMDEPFGALDAQTRIEMQEELIRLTRAEPRTVLFVTHSVEEAAYLADRVVVMAGRPGAIIDVVEVAATRARDGWDVLPIDDVMLMPSFLAIRARLWRLMRGLHGAPTPHALPRLDVSELIQ